MRSLLSHLRTEKSCIEEFLTLLEREKDAMMGGRFDELGPLTQQKAALLERMAALDLERMSALVSLGFEPGRDGADAAASAAGAQTREVWDQLLVLAEEAKAANHRNGSMVYTHLDFTQKALNFLQASAQLFYGPDGIRKTASGGGNRLAMG
jgi:flagellar biosynthesis protein FlgN